MSIVGVLVNTALVLVGGTIGTLLRRWIPQKVGDTVMAGLGRTVKTDFSARQFAQLAKTASGWQTSTYAVTGTAVSGGVQLDQGSAAAAVSRLKGVLKGQ